MAPKASLLTAGDKPKRKRIPIKPLTTQGKTLRALAIKEKQKKNQPREAPSGCENALQTAMADDGTAPKKPKARSFAPPDETDYVAEELQKRRLAKARGAKKEGWNVKIKPLTTQQKTKAAMAIRRAKGGEENEAVHVGRMGKRDVPGLMTILRMQDKEFLPMTGQGRNAEEGWSWGDIKSAGDKRREKKDEERLRSVLFQPTLRARKWRGIYGVKEWPAVKKAEAAESKQAQQAEKTQPAGTAKEGGAEAETIKSEPATGWFTNLPDEVRTRIWKLVVVDDKSCIWPILPTGREQPDVAMTCKQIRQEALQIYYRLNTFGISLQKEPMSLEPAKMGQKKGLTGLAAVHKWASTIGNEDTAWLSMIRDWAFEYQDPAAGWGKGAAFDEDDNSFVVSMRVTSVKQDRPEREEGLEEVEADDEVVTSAGSADVKIHLEASCFMRGWSGCGKCRAPSTPAELDAAVAWMLEAGIFANTLYKFANELRGMLVKLTRARCVRD